MAVSGFFFKGREHKTHTHTQTLHTERGKERGNRATESEIESVLISHVDLMLKGNHEPNVLRPGYFTFPVAVKLYRRE